jgi:hypothetical protein
MKEKRVQRLKEFVEYMQNREDSVTTNMTKEAVLKQIKYSFNFIIDQGNNAGACNYRILNKLLERLSAEQIDELFEDTVFVKDIATTMSLMGYMLLLEPKHVRAILKKGDLYDPHFMILLSAIEDIDNPTDEELESVIEKGGFTHLSLYKFLWGERAYNYLYKDVNVFYIGNFGTQTFTSDFIDFFATLPPDYIEKVSFEDLHFFNCATMNDLCIRNPLYLTHLNKIINPKLATITHIMGSTKYTQLFKLCAAVAYYCNKQAIPDSQKSFLKEYASLIRIYQYDYHTVLAHIVNTVLDNKDGTLYVK